MLKFKVGDRVVVNNELNLNFDESEQETRLIGQVGTIIEAEGKGAFPYQVEFDNKEIQEINMLMGSRLFEEYELNLL